MKKTIYLFLTVLIVGCSSNLKKNDLTVLNLNGNVKSIKGVSAFAGAEMLGSCVLPHPSRISNITFLFMV